jgi:hypothetical protein
MPSYQSWGRLPKATPSAVQRLDWRSELDDLDLGPSSGLPYGLGRSYGDSCLNDGGLLIDTSQLARLIHFDSERGSCAPNMKPRIQRRLANPRPTFEDSENRAEQSQARSSPPTHPACRSR